MSIAPPPPPSEFGTWDVLPKDPTEDELDMTNPNVVDAIERRERLKENWHKEFHYPKGFLLDRDIHPGNERDESWRNWHLRRAWGGINYINGCLRRWSAKSKTEAGTS